MDYTELVDLASERLGGAVVYANDDFFAPKENLLKPSAPVFIEGTYTASGWTDGNRVAAARPVSIGASFDSACPASFAA